MASAAPPIKERRPAAAETPLQLKPVAGEALSARPALAASLSAGIQAKSFVSSPGDAAEREADRVAKQVMTMPAPVVTARGPHSAQRAAVAPLPGLPRAPSPTSPDSAVAAKVRAAATGGTPLSRKTRAFLEPRFRADFSNVAIHIGPAAARLATELGARAFTYGRHIFFGAGQYNPDTRDGLELLSHELTHTIQQSETIQRKEADPAEAPRVTERTERQASRLGISDALDYFADAANAIPGYRMFTILIGVNPINMSAVEASAANILRAIVEFLPGGNIITRVLDSYGIFDKVGGWIEGQLKSLGITGAAIRAAIDRFLDGLGWRDIFNLGSVWDRAKAIFTAPIGRIISFAKGLFSKILEMVQEAVLKPLAALAAQTPFYTLLKAVLGRDPVTGEKFEGGAAEVIGGFMTMIGQQELWQNIQRANAIPRAFAWFKTAMKGLMGLVTSIPTRFIDGLKSLEIMDFVVLPRAFAKIGAVLGSFLADFGSWALGTIIDLLKIIVEVVAPAVLPYIAKAAGAFNTILRNPIGFVGNLVKAAMQGFRQFASRFLTHLQASLVGWLTGAMAGANIYIPQGLNLREILKFVLSILGLTWANIRGKLVRATNETTVVALETGFDIVRTLVTEGPAAAWQKIIEVIGNLKQMAIDAIMDFVKSRVVEAAVTKLLSMLSPAGAFIQAIIAIYNTIMFFVERLRQIAAVAASFIDSIAAIASGSLGAAANKVESTMAGLLTLVISFLARIAGLGRVSDAVTNLINRIRAPIDRALDAVVNWIVTQARRLGRFILQAGTPADPNARLNLAIRDATAIAERLGDRISRPTLLSALAIVRTRYGLTALEVAEQDGEWSVTARINPARTGVVRRRNAAAAAIRRLVGTQIVAQGRPGVLRYTQPIDGYQVRLGNADEFASIRPLRQATGVAALPAVHLDDGGVLQLGQRDGNRHSSEGDLLRTYRSVSSTLGLGPLHPEFNEGTVTRTQNSTVRETLRQRIIASPNYARLSQLNTLISRRILNQGMQGELFEAWIVRKYGSVQNISDSKIKYKTSSGQIGVMDRYSGTTIVEIKSRVRPSSYERVAPDRIPSSAFAVEARDSEQFEKYSEILEGEWECITGNLPNVTEPPKFNAVRYYVNFRGVAIRLRRAMPDSLRDHATFFVGGTPVTSFTE